MSSLDPTRRSVLRLAGAGALALALAGCLRPLYGPTASGQRLNDVLAAIDVAEAVVPVGQERLTHTVRTELIYLLDGSGMPGPKRYRLTLGVNQRVQSAIVDTASGRADSATIVGEVTYQLVDLTGREVTAGTAVASASYDRNPQRFATVRAARDADIRLGKLLAEQIRTRLSAALLTAS